MALILNIESTTDICSIALFDGTTLLAEASAQSNQHAEKMTVLIEACMAQAGRSFQELRAVAVSNGPGSYTSLRIGTSVAKGLCYALNIPMIAVDTLEALAIAAFEAEPKAQAHYYPMIDARRMEVYTAAFQAQDTHLERIGQTQALIIEPTTFDAVLATGASIVLAGNGALKCQEVLNKPQISYLALPCSARYLGHLSQQAFAQQQFVDLAYHTPLYLKMPNITTPKQIF